MPQLRAFFGFVFLLLATGLTAQSAITANLNVTSGSGTLEGYTDPGKTFITLLSTDAVPIFEARLEIRLSVGERTYVLNRNGEAGTISLVSNVPTLLQGLDLAEYFTPNALDPFQRQQLLDDGGLLPGGQTSICVALYDPRFPGAPPVSNNACALAFFEYAQPPLLIDQPDPMAQSIPQAINFQWIPQQFFPATYTIEIWDAQTDLNFGQLFIVNNTPPLVQETVMSSQFLLTDFYPLLPPQTDYIWRVRAEDLVLNRPFINDGFSELGFFRIEDGPPAGCFEIYSHGFTGDENEDFSFGYVTAAAAFSRPHRIEIRDLNTALLLQELTTADGSLYGAVDGKGWTTGELSQIDPTGGPLRVEVCIPCENGIDETCEVFVYDANAPTPTTTPPGTQLENPCPPPVTNLSWTIEGSNSVAISWRPLEEPTEFTVEVHNLSTPPIYVSDAPPASSYATTKNLDEVTPGDQYRVDVCYVCPTTGEDVCAELFFVLPDLEDCNPVLSPVDIAVTPTTAGFAWDVDSEWVDGYSLRVGADSVMIPAGQNSYLWEGLAEGTAYAAELCVYCPGGDNTFRNCVNVSFTTTQFICADEPLLVESVSISSQANGGILVDWSALPPEVAVQEGIVTLLNPATLLAINTYTVENNSSFYVFDAPETEPPYLVRFCLECEGQTTCYEQEIILPGCDDLTISGLNAAEIGTDFAQLYWAGPNGFAVDEYRLRKRLIEGNDTDFEPLGTTTESQFRVEGLLPLRTYEIEICFACDADNQRCDTLEITTEAINCSQAAEEPVAYACGSEADIPEFGQVPLVSHLSPGDSVVAGDFIVLITSVESTGSPWRGSGRIMVPYLNEVELSVDFEAIEVNENCRMTSGEMIVKPPFANLLEDLGDMIDDVTDVLGSVDDILGDILDILETGEEAADYLEPIIAILEVLEEQLDNNPFISPEAEALLEDAISCLQSSIATGNPAACTEILEDLQEALAETYAADYQVPFHRAEEQIYGYDTLSYPEMDILNWYPSIPPISGRPYTAAWVSMPEGTGDRTRAVRVPPGSLDSIRFFGVDSTEIAATITDNGFDLATDYAASPVIYAVHPKADSTGEMSTKIAGQLSLVAYQQKYLDVIFVPVNGAEVNVNTTEIQTELQRIFGPAVVEVSVAADEDLPVIGVGIIPDIASGVRQYPAALRKIIDTYEAERTVNAETYYIFLVEEGENERTGFMPRKKQFGFLFLNRVNNAPGPPGEDLSVSEKMARLAGHELGHGAYHLQHTFEEVGALDAGDTDNLMDYALGGRLHKWQWDFVEDPVGVVGVFEGDDGGSGGSGGSGASGWQIYRGDPNGIDLSEGGTYITPSGSLIYLPVGTIVEIHLCREKFPLFAEGTLLSFEIDGKKYMSVFNNAGPPYLGEFIGYAHLDPNVNPSLSNIDEMDFYANPIENIDYNNVFSEAIYSIDELDNMTVAVYNYVGILGVESIRPFLLFENGYGVGSSIPTNLEVQFSEFFTTYLTSFGPDGVDCSPLNGNGDCLVDLQGLGIHLDGFPDSDQDFRTDYSMLLFNDPLSTDIIIITPEMYNLYNDYEVTQHYMNYLSVFFGWHKHVTRNCGETLNFLSDKFQISVTYLKYYNPALEEYDPNGELGVNEIVNIPPSEDAYAESIIDQQLVNNRQVIWATYFIHKRIHQLRNILYIRNEHILFMMEEKVRSIQARAIDASSSVHPVLSPIRAVAEFIVGKNIVYYLIYEVQDRGVVEEMVPLDYVRNAITLLVPGYTSSTYISLSDETIQLGLGMECRILNITGDLNDAYGGYSGLVAPAPLE